MTSPDPVREAEAYRQSLLAALGDDPAAAQAQTPAALRELVREAGQAVRLGLTFHLAAGHDRVHLAQARRALAAALQSP